MHLEVQNKKFNKTMSITKGTSNTDFNWEYAPAPEAKDHAKLKKQYDLFINGEFKSNFLRNFFHHCQ